VSAFAARCSCRAVDVVDGLAEAVGEGAAVRVLIAECC